MSQSLWVVTQPYSTFWVGCIALVLLTTQLRAIAILFRRPGHRWTRVVRAAIRLGAVLSTLALILQLAIERRQTEPSRARVAVVVDTSASMRQEGRLKSVRQTLSTAQQLWSSAHPLLETSWYSLSGPVDGWPEPHATPWLNKTDLLAGLSQAVSAQGTPLRGILLVSDGADNAELAQHMEGHQGSDSFGEVFGRFNVPISAVSVGDLDPRPDLAITHVTYDSLAFIKVSQALEITLSAAHLVSGQAKLGLYTQGACLSETTISWPDARTTPQMVKATLPLRFTEVGSWPLEVRVDHQPREVDVENNTYPLVVTTARDKLRVVHVAGRPSWDVRFLRQTLRQMPSVDLVSFYILRTFDSDMSIPEQELALIPFPTEQLFTTELKNFDVVLLHNFDARPFGMARFLPNVAQAVAQEGLGLAMVGGPSSFGSGGYQQTPVGDLLPLAASGPDHVDEEVELQVTADGHHSPLTKSFSIASSSPRLLQRHKPMGISAKSTVLLQAAGTRHEKPTPLLAIGRHGRGHTLALATSDLWRWQFSPQATAETQHAYEKFWRESLRFLSGDDDQSPLRVLPVRNTFDTLDDPPVVRVETRTEDLTAAPHQSVELAVTNLSGQTVWQQSILTDKEGSAVVTVPQPTQGSYRLRAEWHPQDASSAHPTSSAAFAIRPLTRESQQSLPRPDWLAKLTERTGGRLFAKAQAHDAFDQMPLAPPPPARLLGLERKGFWDDVRLWALCLTLWVWAWILERAERAGGAN